MTLRYTSLITFHLAVLCHFLAVCVAAAGDECLDGWFGSRCQFKCHCKNFDYCDGFTGACVDDVCASGWFGDDCQYADWVVQSNAPDWLKDGDHTTCNPDTTNETLEIQFPNITIIKYRLIGVDSPAKDFASLVVSTDKKQNISDQYIKQNDNTFEFFVTTITEVSQYVFYGPGVFKLCTLYMTPGRNLALKQTVTMSSQLQPGDLRATSPTGHEPSDGYYSVDGNRGQDYYKDGCAYTASGDKKTFWRIIFDHPVQIYTISIYNIHHLTACPNFTVMSDANICHFVIKTELDWYAGRRRCWNHSGEAVIFTEKEQWDLLNGTGILPPDCWIGLKDYTPQPIDGWRWVPNKRLQDDYSYWDIGQPDEVQPSEDCIMVTEDHKWDDQQCVYDAHISCCSMEARTQMMRFTLEGFDENGAKVYGYTHPFEPFTITHVSPDRHPAIKTVKVIGKYEFMNIHICEFEAYGETICKDGSFGPECNLRCNCADGTPCDPSGWCKTGCATGFKEPFCLGCPKGFFGLPSCQYPCSRNCIAGCKYRNGHCIGGCIGGAWGRDCSRNCSSACASTCNHKTGQCPITYKSGQGAVIASSILIPLLLLLLLLLCLLCRKRKEPMVAEERSPIGSPKRSSEKKRLSERPIEIVEEIKEDEVSKVSSGGKSKASSGKTKEAKLFETNPFDTAL